MKQDSLVVKIPFLKREAKAPNSDYSNIKNERKEERFELDIFFPGHLLENLTLFVYFRTIKVTLKWENTSK